MMGHLSRGYFFNLGTPDPRIYDVTFILDDNFHPFIDYLGRNRIYSYNLPVAGQAATGIFTSLDRHRCNNCGEHHGSGRLGYICAAGSSITGTLGI